MFERFTDRARRALVIAQEEARALEHGFIRPEHLLLGLAKGDGVASTVLSELGVRYDTVRDKVAHDHPATPGAGHLGKVPFSPQAKKALELSLREALRLGHNYIGTEHLLLGLLRGAEAKDNEVKEILGGLAGQLRARVTELVASGPGGSPPRSPALSEALKRAAELAGAATVTTGHLLTALVDDTRSQAARALEALGVTSVAVAAAIAQVAVATTSDAVPGTGTVELKIGDVTTTIDDPELAAALRGLSADQVRSVLAQALGYAPRRPAAG